MKNIFYLVFILLFTTSWLNAASDSSVTSIKKYHNNVRINFWEWTDTALIDSGDTNILMETSASPHTTMSLRNKGNSSYPDVGHIPDSIGIYIEHWGQADTSEAKYVYQASVNSKTNWVTIGAEGTLAHPNATRQLTYVQRKFIPYAYLRLQLYGTDDSSFFMHVILCPIYK